MGSEKETVVTPQAPEVPSPADVARQTYQTQIEFGPKLARQELGLIKELYPEEYALQKAAIGELGEDIGAARGYLPEPLKAAIGEYTRAAQSVRGLAESGMGAAEEAGRYANLAEQIRSGAISSALGVGARYIPSISLKSYAPSTEAMYGLSTGLGSLAQQQYATDVQRRLEEQQLAAQQQAGKASAIGSMVGGGLGMLAGGQGWLGSELGAMGGGLLGAGLGGSAFAW